MKNITESNWTPPNTERKATRAERRKPSAKTWNPLPAWRTAALAWRENRRKVRENDDKGRAVVTGRTIFIAEDRRAFLKTLGSAAVVAVMLSTELLGSDPARASQLANFIQFVGAGDGATDDSAAFQSAQNTAAAQVNGGAVFCPPPSVSYVVDNITLKNQVDIIGGSMRATQFQAKAGSTNSVFNMDVGHVINCRYENIIINAAPVVSFTATGSGTNLTISGVSANTLTVGVGGSDVQGTGIPINTYLVSQTSGTTGGAGVYVTNNATTASAAACTGIQRQHCFNLVAVIGGSGDGGMWYSIFKNVFAQGFGGYAWWFRGGPNSFLQPHQFITLDSCIATRPNTWYSRCVLLTGQCGQFKFQGVCDFDGGFVATNGFNIELGAEFVVGSLVGGPLIGGTTSAGGGGSPANGPRTPYNILFYGVTSQNALMAYYTYNTFDVILDCCYCEDVAQPFLGTGACVNFNVVNCHVTNSAQLSGAGFVFSLGNSSTGSITGTDTAGPLDRFISNDGGNWGVFTENNSPTTAATNTDSNVSLAVNGSTVQIRRAFSCSINSTTAMATINSLHAVGAKVTFINNQGGPSATLVKTGNITLGHWTTLTLGDLDEVVVQLLDVTGKWGVIGTTGVLS